MKCEDFTGWLQETLDQREGLELPQDLRRHVQDCDCCRGQLDAWHRIASIMPKANPVLDQQTIAINRGENRRRIQRVAGVVAAAAAVTMLVFVIKSYNDNPTQIVKAETPDAALQDVIDPGNAVVSVDPVVWWQQIQNRDWIGQTIPSVESMRDGVAPFGKPFRQAVSILTMGGRDRPS